MEGIAIIGLAGRFPGANNIADFWQNLCDGVEAISQFSDEELVAAGVDSSLLNNSNYIKAGAVLENIDLFDASFFGFNPKEAEMTDPQHRLFLECAWEALENAGYDAQRCESRIGVYAGTSLSNYLTFNLNRDRIGSAHSFQKLIGNDKDFLSTRVSYKLNLTGPSLTIQTACSTSLVATALACQSLLNYQCDMALTGGASIRVPQKTGYLYQEGGILSPDGHCRAFDAKAKGTIIGNGVGVTLLKRLSDAIADGDHIYAVIKGSAINNDGSGKVGYTAPSVNGQAEAIAEAIALADIEPETISYIETHGTGTALGDPIEIAALTNVFRAETEKKGFCAIGSVKTNIGHLDAAAGVTGLIKTALALQHKLIPPSLNFEQPNPEIDFANSPFYVNTKLTEWSATSTPRRAGVSSLGIGGTNAHVILEEAPSVTRVEKQKRDYQLLVLSAKTDSALETATKNLVQHLRQHPELNLADVAYTLQVGRGVFDYRRFVVCQSTQEAINALESIDPQQVLTHFQETTQRSITFMFPGQGTQYVGMGKELYQTEPIFREQVDRCCLLLEPHLGLDLRSVIYA
ncbi:MAG: type I polyketide synthase, partial [Nostoc sp. C3-bin3]|nr:type I polyketide synthase [Nostoc sp. C3-bin3]